MITGIRDVYYNVKDMDRARAFYMEALGMKVIRADKWWSSLECGGVTVGLHWTEGPAVPATPRDSHGSHAGGTLTLASTDIAEDRKCLEGTGAKILGEADQPWGHMLVFEDPDGNVLKLMKPKY